MSDVTSGYVLNVSCRVMLAEGGHYSCGFRVSKLLPVASYYWDDERRKAAHTDWEARRALGDYRDDDSVQGAVFEAKWYDTTLVSVTPDGQALVHVHAVAKLLIVPLEAVQYRGRPDLTGQINTECPQSHPA